MYWGGLSETIGRRLVRFLPKSSWGNHPTGETMIVQCSQCLRIRVDGVFRLPWPGEVNAPVAEVFCPRCAKDLLARIQAGEFAQGAEAGRIAANS